MGECRVKSRRVESVRVKSLKIVLQKTSLFTLTLCTLYSTRSYSLLLEIFLTDNKLIALLVIPSTLARKNRAVSS